MTTTPSKPLFSSTPAGIAAIWRRSAPVVSTLTRGIRVADTPYVDLRAALAIRPIAVGETEFKAIIAREVVCDGENTLEMAEKCGLYAEALALAPAAAANAAPGRRAKPERDKLHATVRDKLVTKAAEARAEAEAERVRLAEIEAEFEAEADGAGVDEDDAVRIFLGSVAGLPSAVAHLAATASTPAEAEAGARALVGEALTAFRTGWRHAVAGR